MKVILLALSLFSTSTLACNVTGSKSISSVFDYHQDEGYFYNTFTGMPNKAKILVSNCKSSKRKYLQITHGVSESYIDNSVSEVISADTYFPKECTITNSPFKNQQTAKERNIFFKQKKMVIDSCYEQTVTIISDSPYELPKQQDLCSFKKIGDNKFIYKGRACFLPIKNKTNFLLELTHKKSCLNLNYYRENKIDLQEIKSQIDFNVVNTNDGTGKNLKTISRAVLNTTIPATKTLFNVTDNYGAKKPILPTTWSIPNIHLANLKFKRMGHDLLSITTPLIVDNRCEKSCADGLCSSPCSYSSPVAGEFSLYSIRKVNGKSKKTFLTSWYNGGIAQQNWQGQIRGEKHFLDPRLLDKNTDPLRLEIVFRDPQLDYYIFKKQVSTLFPKIPSLMSALSSGLEPLDSTEDLMQFITGFNFFGADMDRDSQFNLFSKAMSKFQNIFKSPNWPDYYEDVCNSDLKVCKSPDKGINLKIVIDFNLELEHHSTKQPILKINKVTNKSSLSDSIKTYTELPKFSCGI